jgi:hypothetical protein
MSVLFDFFVFLFKLAFVMLASVFLFFVLLIASGS